jgi:anti-sigma factor RsiW
MTVSEDVLHAYVDGRLDPAERLRVEAWLAEHPDDAATVHAYLLQNVRLRETFDAVLAEEIPADTAGIVTARRSRAPRAPARTVGMRLAASLALLLAGGAGGWALHGALDTGVPRPAASFADQAIGAHRVFVTEVRHPVEVPANQETHLVAWLSKRLDTELRAPDLTAMGLALVGGRLLADGPRPAAQLMYEGPEGRRATVYVRAADEHRDTSFRFVSGDEFSAFYWVEKSFAYALVGPMPRDELLKVARAVYGGLDRP